MPYRPQLSYVIAEDPASYATPDIEPVHIWWSSREDIVALRKKFVVQWLLASIELWILIFLISALYLGSGHNPNRYTTNLDVALVNFDGDLAGYYFFNAFQQSPSGNLTLHWHYKYPSDYNNNLGNAQSDVENGKVWATVVLLPYTTRLIDDSLSAFINATTLLTSPFIFTPPISVTYESGRNSYTINNYVLPAIESAIAVANFQYGQTLREQLVENLSSSSDSSSDRSLELLNTFQLGSLLVDPLAAKYHDIHPASPYVGQLATTLGYIYLYLTTGLVVGGALKFVSQFVGKIHYLDLLVCRVFNGFFQGFIISLIYSLIVLWFFGIHSGSLFMRYWMFNWLATLVFGIIIVLFTINLGPLGNSLLTAFVVFMLAGATIQISLELSPRFYRYGYGLPLYHILNGGRHLLFNSHSRFGLDVGVLLIYFGVLWTVAIITSILWMRRQEQKFAKENQKKKTTEENLQTKSAKENLQTKSTKENLQTKSAKENLQTKSTKKNQQNKSGKNGYSIATIPRR